MNGTAKTIGKIIVAFFAAMCVGGGLIESSVTPPNQTDGVVAGILVFVSVIALHLLTWNYIVPTLPLRDAFKISKGRRALLSGLHALGYSQIAIFCLSLAGLRLLSGNPAFPLFFGMALIALGMATRLRDVFAGKR